VEHLSARTKHIELQVKQEIQLLRHGGLLPEFFNEEGYTNGKAKNASVYWRDEVLSPPSLSKAEVNLMAFHG
jgi:hypothetical protein